MDSIYTIESNKQAHSNHVRELSAELGNIFGERPIPSIFEHGRDR